MHPAKLGTSVSVSQTTLGQNKKRQRSTLETETAEKGTTPPNSAPSRDLSVARVPASAHHPLSSSGALYPHPFKGGCVLALYVLLCFALARKITTWGDWVLFSFPISSPPAV